jgi:hypothetical protein
MSDQEQEWRYLAWYLAARELAVDLDVGDGEFEVWAEEAFGSLAREFIALADALTVIRFGPETHPRPAPRALTVDVEERRTVVEAPMTTAVWSACAPCEHGDHSNHREGLAGICIGCPCL